MTWNIEYYDTDCEHNNAVLVETFLAPKPDARGWEEGGVYRFVCPTCDDWNDVEINRDGDRTPIDDYVGK
jgi:hypothetical protein